MKVEVVQHVGHISGLHRGAQLPGHDVAEKVIKDCGQAEPSLAGDTQVGDVGLPELFRCRRFVLEGVCGLHNDEGGTGDEVKRVNRLAIVQEHFMILRALQRGVPEKRLAKALDIKIETIRRKRDFLRMKQEMSLVQNRFKLIEQSYGNDVPNMALARGYHVKLLSNRAVASYLQRCQPELLQEFRGTVDPVSLEDAGGVAKVA